MKALKISIITATFNSEKSIEDTLNSVLSQTYPNIEHIIVDGASTDRTMEIVKQYEHKYNNNFIYKSEKDQGIYDALNKGIAMATGDVVGFLHSDDLYANPNVVQKIAERFMSEECDGVYGDLVFIDTDDKTKVKRIWITGTGRFEWGWTIPHQTLYLKRSVYEQFGDYLTDMRNAADNEFILRVCKDGRIKTSYIKDVLVLMKMGGASTKNVGSSALGFKEVQRSLTMHGIHAPALVNTLRLFRKGKQVLRAKLGRYKVEI